MHRFLATFAMRVPLQEINGMQETNHTAVLPCAWPLSAQGLYDSADAHARGLSVAETRERRAARERQLASEAEDDARDAARARQAAAEAEDDAAIEEEMRPAARERQLASEAEDDARKARARQAAAEAEDDAAIEEEMTRFQEESPHQLSLPPCRLMSF